VKITDESAHEPSLTDARGKGKADGREVALEVSDRRKLGTNSLERGLNIGAFSGRRYLRYSIEDFQRAALGRPKTQPTRDRVHLTVHERFA
jgi:hypothetical protein